MILVIYDALGREVEEIINKTLESRKYEVTLDGSKFSSGVYFYNITLENISLTKKLLLLR